jgi:DNA-binding NarL/FixJ family response regulator
MMPKKCAAISQQTGDSRALPPVGPRLAFARDESSGHDVNLGNERRILIVEDDFLIAADARSALAEAGFTVVGVAASAEEAIQIAAARQPALVIMDIRLTGRRDGIELALELFRRQRLRCIFATAHIDEEAKKRAEPAQPLGWLPKPYTSASLVALVQRVWSRSS